MIRLLCLLWPLALAAQSEPLRNPRNSPEDVAAGASTFRSHCAACHGMRGEGGRGPNLASGTFYHGGSDAELLNTISSGIPGTEMPGLFYSPDRVWQIVAYIRTLSRQGAPQPAGDPAAGARLYRENGCAGCHRVAGEGGRLGPDLTEIGVTRSPEHLRQALLDPNADVRARYWIVTATGAKGEAYSGFLMNEDTYTLQLLGFDEKLRSVPKSGLSSYKIDKVSKMPSYSGKLQERELTDLVSYLASLKGATR